MKARFKIKLNQNDLEAMHLFTMCVCATVKDEDVALVPMYDLMTNLALRLANMYKPEKPEYTLRLSSVEAYVLMQRITKIGFIQIDTFRASLAQRVSNELQRQFDHELCSVNALLNYKPHVI